MQSVTLARRSEASCHDCDLPAHGECPAVAHVPVAPRRHRSTRPLAINNSLVHGICNCNCRLCAVNKASYSGPQEYQPLEVTQALIRRVIEAAQQGLRIRYIGNAGDGEPTLHPDFIGRMRLFGDMIRTWDDRQVPAPEVAVITNGGRLHRPGILEAIADNGLTLIISFPSIDPEAYGHAMMGDGARGEALLKQVLPAITAAMTAAAKGSLRRLQFHISPPERDLIRATFDRTVEYLSSTAARVGLDHLELIMFPATANRSGLIRNVHTGVDFYRDLFRRHNRRLHHGVRVDMKLSFQRFFPKMREFRDLLRHYAYPCVWNGQFFFTADGTSICCNDQAVRMPLGNLRDTDLSQLLAIKEDFLPAVTCKGCDQAPQRMQGGRLLALFRFLAGRKLRRSLREQGRTEL